MGGRGRSSGVNQRQISVDKLLLIQDIAHIKSEADAIRASIDSAIGSGSIAPATSMKQCFCCGEYSIPIDAENETCPNCGWVDDKFQNAHPDSMSGNNPVCLNEFKEAYRKNYEWHGIQA